MEIYNLAVYKILRKLDEIKVLTAELRLDQVDKPLDELESLLDDYNSTIGEGIQINS